MSDDDAEDDAASNVHDQEPEDTEDLILSGPSVSAAPTEEVNSTEGMLLILYFTIDLLPSVASDRQGFPNSNRGQQDP